MSISRFVNYPKVTRTGETNLKLTNYGVPTGITTQTPVSH
jgi:hypothetical protein